MKPFIEAGPSFRTISGAANRFVSKNGLAAGAGLDLRVFHVTFEPEIRYTYWTANPPAAAAGSFATHHNQAELLVGLLF